MRRDICGAVPRSSATVEADVIVILRAGPRISLETVSTDAPGGAVHRVETLCRWLHGGYMAL
jgi:hypothetical protein